MTQNQIAYWNLQETKRSNQVREGETNRHNVVTESETNRANLRKEELTADIQEAQKKRMAVQNVTDVLRTANDWVGPNALEKKAKAVSSIIPFAGGK